VIPIPPPWVWFGGQRCEEVQLRAWLSSALVTEAQVEVFRADLTEKAIDSFEQHTGLAPNLEVVALAREYWEPYALPIAQQQWTELIEPSVLWWSGQVSCVQAWGLARSRQPELEAALFPSYSAFLAERRALEPTFEQQLDQMLLQYSTEFAWQALEALPGPPTDDVRRAVRP
jgi:hypothetical protein